MTNLEQIKKLPKIELHAHLSGSVRDSTVYELIELNGLSPDDYPSVEHRNLEQCFKCFSILHKILNNKETLERVTREIFEDFYNDNVVYLELRTTPRDIYDNINNVLIRKEDYIDLIINIIKEFETKYSDSMIIRLILSCDRTKPLKDNIETIELANKFKNETNYVVGVDFSGHPNINSFQDLNDLFELCKKYNLNTSVHIAETWQDNDIDFILKSVQPNRLGHAVCLKNEHIDYLLKNQIPIEICPSSNLMTQCVDQIDNHIFNDFYTKSNNKYPLTICTDDFGILNTTLSNEYHLISKAFGLSLEKIFDLSFNSIQNIFDKSDETKEILLKKFTQFKNLYYS